MSAKDIMLKPITATEGNALVKRVHYSGKVVNKSRIHMGVYYKGKLEGAMQFGPPMDTRKLQGLVRDTGWNDFIELNRMAFTDTLPRNSESRALGVAFRLLKKHAPHLKWIVSFSDGAQCGDGTIYRASGFVLTGIKTNDQIWVAPDGTKIARLTATNNNAGSGRAALLHYARRFGEIGDTNKATMAPFVRVGYTPLPGFQLRYVYFLDPTWRERLTVPELPFSRIQEMGAGMYRGERRTLPLSAGSIDSDALGFQPREGSAILTSALQKSR